MPKLPIDPQREYSPSEIAKHGFIVNTVGKGDYRYVLRLIESKELKARNAANLARSKTGQAKYFKVLGADIISWKNATVTIEEQPTVIKRQKGERYPYPQPTVTHK